MNKDEFYDKLAKISRTSKTKEEMSKKLDVLLDDAKKAGIYLLMSKEELLKKL
jgi:hypothetical protein